MFKLLCVTTQWILILLFLWVLLVAGIATPALNLITPRLAEQTIGLPVRFGVLLIDPFAIRLSGEALEIRERTGQIRLNVADFSGDVALLDSIRSGSLVVSDIVVQQWQSLPAEGQASQLAFKRLTIGPVTINPTQSRLSINHIALQGPQLKTDFVEGVSSLPSLWDGLVPDAPPPATTTDTLESSAWSVELGRLALSDGAVSIHSDLLAPERVDVELMSLTIDDLTLPASAASGIHLSAHMDDEIPIDLDGELHLEQGTGTLNLATRGIALERLSPLITREAGVVVSGGRIDLALSAGLRGFLPETLKGDLSVADTALTQPGQQSPLLEIRHLALTSLALDASQQLLDLERADFSGVRSFLHIRDDGSLNVLSLGELTEEVAEDSEAYAREIAAAESVPTGHPWRIRVGQTTLSDSVLDFKDDTLPVDFIAHIEALNGELEGFDTAIDSEAVFHASGNINGYSPVDISGRLQHFSTPEDGHFTLSARGVDLGRLTPYSATYAGYPIERGVMTLELDYALEQRKINGNNHLRIDQLALGKKQPSDRAVIDLPLQTAVALLSDAAGVIDISLPVSGSADDPQFDIWAAAGTAFANLLTNMVAAPFKFLASLVGGDDIPQQLRFPPGAARLTDEAREVLTMLGNAMEKRPRIALRLTPHSDRNADIAALQRQRFHQQLIAAGLTDTDIEQRSPAWEVAIDALADAAGLQAGEPAVVKALLLREGIAISALELEQLGNRRATEVKRYLVETEHLDPQRAAIAVLNDNTGDDFAGVALEIRVR